MIMMMMMLMMMMMMIILIIMLTLQQHHGDLTNSCEYLANYMKTELQSQLLPDVRKTVKELYRLDAATFDLQ
jgi:predicted unusual protein kinase regulating ubiquinone biosynthesis (AarF/ABC1/UbiB family)